MNHGYCDELYPTMRQRGCCAVATLSACLGAAGPSGSQYVLRQKVGECNDKPDTDSG